MAFLLLHLACTENELIAKEDDPVGTTSAEAPDILVDPLEVDFGEVQVGRSAAATVTISNRGDASLTVEDLELAGAGNFDLSWTNLGTPLLPPGGVTDTVVTWTPTAAGALAEELEVRSNDPDTPLIGVRLIGGVPGGDLVLEPALYDFGTLAVGDSAMVELVLSNVGEGPVVVSDWSYNATDADMRVVDPGGLAVTPVVFDAGESTSLWVEYAPSSSGADEGALQVDSDDSDEPQLVANQLGSGEVDDPCKGFTQTVRLMLTADDAWQGWIDGTAFSAPNQNTWSASDTMEWEMECGDHTLALYATDTAQAVSGVIAVVWVEGAVRFVSGPTDWTMLDTSPPSGWQDVGFDDSGWNIPQVCADTSLWGSYPQPFYDQGAQWIWWTTQCRNLGEAWLRLNFTVP